MDNITIPNTAGGIHIETPSTLYENYFGHMNNITLVNSKVGKSGGGIVLNQVRNQYIEDIHFENNKMSVAEGYPGGGGISIKDGTNITLTKVKIENCDGYKYEILECNSCKDIQIFKV